MGKKSKKKKSDSSNDEVEWVEKKEKKEKPVVKGPQLPIRDDKLIKEESNNWLMINETDKDAFGAFGRLFEKPNEVKKKVLQDELHKVQSERELNPYWREGGSGMPEEESKVQSSTQQASSIGDGGLAWWSKALERCQEQAKETNRGLEEIAAERYGSLDFLLNKILDAREMNKQEKDNGNKKQQTKFTKPDEFKSNFFGKHSRTRDQQKYESEKRHLKKRDCSPYRDSRENKSSKNKKQKSWSNSSSSSSSSRDEKIDKKKRKSVTRRSHSPLHKPNTQEYKRTTEESQQNKESEPEEDLNDIGARIIKAELMGEDAVAEKLKQKLEYLKRNPKRFDKKHSSKSSQVLIATKTDRFGNEVTLKRHQIDRSSNNDATKLDLKALVEQEKNETMEENALLFSTIQGKSFKNDSDDDTFTQKNEKAIKQLSGWSKIQALVDQRTKNDTLTKCHLCIDNAKKHLIIATGSHSYICVPEQSSLVDQHCYIVPFQHYISSLMVDEDVWYEMQMFRKALVKMFLSQEFDCLFVEQFVNEKNFEHMFIECIPLNRESGSLAPMYFKKALLESESEWAQNKCLIELKDKGGLRRAVPKGLPFYAIHFGLDDGYAHIIENKGSFPKHFTKEIVGGMLDLETHTWRGSRNKESFKELSAKVIDFQRKFKQFDFTK